MITSIILMNIKRNNVNKVADLLVEMPEISEVYSVSGKYDLVAIIRVKDNDDLASLVTNKLSKFEDIEKTDTMLAFKAYSRHDLDSMFSL
ncbi:MAG: Lrp/AsnC family transcriptional regulator [Gammaproteobacteria bacterium]|nr:Lrp/AsnC family transcriptional regulator [Gammaproteobacteria bacterium]